MRTGQLFFMSQGGFGGPLHCASLRMLRAKWDASVIGISGAIYVELLCHMFCHVSGDIL